MPKSYISGLGPGDEAGVIPPRQKGLGGHMWVFEVAIAT
jgi:hypothetical protein